MRATTRARGETNKVGELSSSTGAMSHHSAPSSVVKPTVDMSGPVYDEFCMPPAVDTKPKLKVQVCILFHDSGGLNTAMPLFFCKAKFRKADNFSSFKVKELLGVRCRKSQKNFFKYFLKK